MPTVSSGMSAERRRKNSKCRYANINVSNAVLTAIYIVPVAIVRMPEAAIAQMPTVM